MTDGAAEMIRFEVLGSVRAVRGAADIALGPAKQLATLAVLLMRAGSSVPRDEIVAGVWGEEAPASASNLVATYVAGLRRALEPARPIVSSPSGYLLRVEPGAIDLHLFDADLAEGQRARQRGDLDACVRAFRAALGRWRGPALDGVPGPHAEQARGHLAERRQALLEQRIEVDIVRGRHAEWIPDLGQLVAAHPLREPLHGMLMLALYRSGRQAEALTVFHEARRKLADELGVEPGAPLRELYQGILGDDVSPRGLTATALGGPVQPHPVPHQLPSDIPDFAGRADEVRRLTERLLGSATMAACVLTGIDGIGKTTLAVRVAHQVADRFPDGQLYVNLRGSNDRPLTHAEILGRLLTDLGLREDQLPGDTERQAALLRTRLSGRRVLLVLDDATDGAQVTPALPGSGGCAVLITSRVRMTDLPGSLVLALDPLDTASARRLLASLVGVERVAAEPGAATDIIDRCGGLPLALRIAGVRLAGRPGWPLATLADRAADDRRRLDELGSGDLEVRGGFRVGYEALPGGGRDGADAARAFRLLGALPMPVVSPDTVAAVLDVPTRQAERTLELLADAHLVEPASPGRYRFNDLLRLFAREQSRRHDRPTVLDGMRRRALDFYRVTALEADLLLRPGRRTHDAPPQRDGAAPSFRTTRQALQWWEGERATVLDIVVTSARQPDGEPRQLATLLTDLRSFLHRRGHWADWQTLGAEVLRAGQRRGDRPAEAIARFELGTLGMVRATEPDSAKSYLQGSIELFRDAGDRLGQSRALNNIAVVHANSGNYTDSAAALRESLLMQRADADLDGECITLDNLARLRTLQRDYARAAVCCSRSVRLRQEAGTPNLSAFALSVLGQVHSATGQHAVAVEDFDRALALARADGNRYREAHALKEFGTAQYAAGQPKQAVESLESALALQRELGDRYAVAGTLLSLSKALQALDRPVEAVRYRSEATELSGDLDPKPTD